MEYGNDAVMLPRHRGWVSAVEVGNVGGRSSLASEVSGTQPPRRRQESAGGVYSSGGVHFVGASPLSRGTDLTTIADS